MTKKNQLAGETNLVKALKKIEESLKSIELRRGNFRTNCRYEWSNGERYVSIDKANKLPILIEAYSDICKEEFFYNMAIKELKLTEFPVLMIQGHTADDWKNDINVRIQMLEDRELIEKLKKARSILQLKLSGEEQAAIILKELGFGENPFE